VGEAHLSGGGAEKAPLRGIRKKDNVDYKERKAGPVPAGCKIEPWARRKKKVAIDWRPVLCEKSLSTSSTWDLVQQKVS